ncbi:MAG: AAA family ATPase [Lachnospiraceae bacterium]
MYRKDSVTVGEWIRNSNKALLVTGARQTGKTWLIRDEIEKSRYTKFEVNFIDQPDMITYLNAEMSALDMLKEKFETRRPVDEFIHQKLLSLFFVYLIVGGMPDAVKTYIETKDIREVDKVQRDIITLYKEIFSQYELENKKLRLKSIYDIIPAELNKQNKKFVLTC